MSEYDPPDGSSVERVVTQLEEAVGRLLTELSELRARVERAETAHLGIQHALEAARVDGLGPQDLEARLAELAEENEHLHRVIAEGRQRAERIRQRLRIVEDDKA
ncbi:MAG: hypothetical protein ACE5JR_10380 [Gemmatimonadota bacterium]